MMARPALDNLAARRLFLHRHGLGQTPAGPGKGADLLALVKELGFVQVDSVNTLARAHDMILFARRPAYRPRHLQRLIETDRALFEHWTHDASVIPTDYLPHWQLRFRRDAERLRARWPRWQGETFLQELQKVRDHVSAHGEVCSADLKAEEAATSTGWWDWHPSKAALEYLWRSGELAIARRRSFRKFYDLRTRVLGTCRVPDEAETLDWLMQGALDRLGFATSGELAAFWDIASAQEARDWCAQALAAGQIEEIEVAGADGAMRRSYARPGTLAEAETLPPPPARLRVLSPFDPALRDRKRAERLFGFHYRIEIFVPAPKRIYGYYVFPLLEGERLVGRIDMRADRDSGILQVTRLWPERGVKFGKGRQERLDAELARVARFAELDGVAFDPDWLADPK